MSLNLDFKVFICISFLRSFRGINPIGIQKKKVFFWIDGQWVFLYFKFITYDSFLILNRLSTTLSLFSNWLSMTLSLFWIDYRWLFFFLNWLSSLMSDLIVNLSRHHICWLDLTLICIRRLSEFLIKIWVDLIIIRYQIGKKLNIISII